MEGLEAAEVKSSLVLKGDLRLEAKFFTLKTLNTNEFFLGSNILDFGQYNSIYGLTKDKSGHPIIRMNEFEGIFTATPTMYCANLSDNEFESLCLKKNDILICRTNGNPQLIGKSALVAKDYPYAYESHLFKIRPKNNFINSASLVTFLNTKYGRMEIEKLSMQGNQANFSLAKFKEIRIPKLNKHILDSIERVVYSSFFSLENSQKIYTTAENFLLDTLGLKKFSSNTENINLKSFSESFGATGRLDAEFFSPKITQLLKILGKDKQSIKDVAPVRHERFIPSNAGTFNYIEIGGVQQDGTVIAKLTEHQEAPSRATSHVTAGDVVTSTVRPIRRLSALITPEQNNFVCSSGFVVLNPTTVASEVLLTYLKLPVVCELMDLYTSASLYPAISETDLLNLPFPYIA